MSDAPRLIGRNRVGPQANSLGRAITLAPRSLVDAAAPKDGHGNAGGKKIGEINADHQEWLDAQELTTACAFCDWSFTGRSDVGRDAARQHREAKHPEANVRRSRRGSLIVPKHRRTEAEEAEAAVNAAEANRVRAEREDAERVAKIERGRQRDALAALDAGEPQDREEEKKGPPQSDEPPTPQTAGSPPPRDETGDEGTPMQTVAERLGLRKFGRGYIWTREAMLEAVRVFVAENGEPPNREDSKRAPVGTLPSTKSIGGEFADWNELVAAAGFTPLTAQHRSGRGPRAGTRSSGRTTRSQEQHAAPAAAEQPSRPENDPIAELATKATELADQWETEANEMLAKVAALRESAATLRSLAA